MGPTAGAPPARQLTRIRASPAFSRGGGESLLPIHVTTGRGSLDARKNRLREPRVRLGSAAGLQIVVWHVSRDQLGLAASRWHDAFPVHVQ